MGATVVVGVANEETAGSLVRWAAVEAGRRGAALHVVHVVPTPGTSQGEPVPAGELPLPAREAQELLERCRAHAAAVAPAVPLSTALPQGSARRVLVAESTAAALVVVGARGQAGLAGRLLGSTSSSVAARAHCPVAVLQGSEDVVAGAPGGDVVVAVDGSEESAGAVVVAADLAGTRAATLVVVHVWDVLEGPTAWGAVLQEELTPRVERERVRLVREAVEAVRSLRPGLDVRGRAVRAPRVPEAVLEVAAGADVLVLGSRGRGTLSAALLGSISHEVLQDARVPVVVVPRTAVPAVLG